MSLLAFAFAAALSAQPPAPAPPEARTPITFSQLLARPREKADRRIAYGTASDQYGELWLPRGAGPHPVAVLVHGGCWRDDLPGLELMDYMAADLRRRGVAVWNLEYRRVGAPGGGYPGTFSDVSRGVEHLRTIAPAARLDLSRVVVSGHSAGGHLALWAGTRHRLPRSSPLRLRQPLAVRGVVTLAGINDLQAYRATGPEACGGPATIDSLVGMKERRARAFTDTSPPMLARSGVRQVIISGGRDHIVPPRFGQTYARTALMKGDAVDEVTLGEAGHFELIDPTAPAWETVRGAIERLLGPRTAARR